MFFFHKNLIIRPAISGRYVMEGVRLTSHYVWEKDVMISLVPSLLSPGRCHKNRKTTLP